MNRLLVVLMLLEGFYSVEAHAEEFSASNQNEVRIENEYKLSLPVENIEEVWRYLLSKYEDSSRLFLKNVDFGFSTKFSTEYFTDTYFDTANYTLLNRQSGIRWRRRFMPDDISNKKNGRSLVQIKLGRSDGDLNRSEIKFVVDESIPSTTDWVNSPYFLIGKNKHKSGFLKILNDLEINPMSLKAVITLNQTRRRVYISLRGKPFATITLDEVSSKIWWQKVKFAEVELELNEILYTDSNLIEREKMEELNKILKGDLSAAFPFIHQDQTPKYNKSILAIQNEIPFFKILKYLI